MKRWLYLKRVYNQDKPSCSNKRRRVLNGQACRLHVPGGTPIQPIYAGHRVDTILTDKYNLDSAQNLF